MTSPVGMPAGMQAIGAKLQEMVQFLSGLLNTFYTGMTAFR
jgi:hypothetical protein